MPNWVSWVDRHCKLESELPAERRCTDTSNEEIVETDDPRWIEAERQLDLNADAEIEAAYTLIEVIPTTRPGCWPCLSTLSATTRKVMLGPMIGARACSRISPKNSRSSGRKGRSDGQGRH